MSAETQRDLCARNNADFLECRADDKLGIALQTLGTNPLNGLRIKPENGTCGWYIWAGGEMSEDREFFQPLHVSHMEQRCPEAVPYLGLAPGWRFLIAPGYEDIWFDEDLLSP